MSIFEKLEKEAKKSLFKNKSILSADYSPESASDVFGRDQQKNEIAKKVFDLMEGIETDLYIYGHTGVGKTFTTRAIINEAKKKYANKFKFGWVSCSAISPVSKFQISCEIANQLGGDFGKGHSAGDCIDYIKGIAKKSSLLVVIDEIDKLARQDDSLLLTFCDIPNLSQFLISNDLTWTDNLDSRIISRSHDNRLDFHPYSKEELSIILKRRFCSLNT